MPTIETCQRYDVQPRSDVARWRRASNPFSTRFVASSVQTYDFGLCDTSLDRLAYQVSRAKRHQLIVGPHGTGKSTLLANIQNLLQKQSKDSGLLVTLHASEPNRHVFYKLRKLKPDSLLIVDGFEQLRASTGWLLRGACRMRRIRLLATTHHDCEGFAILHRTTASKQQAHKMLCELLSDEPHRIGDAQIALDLIWPKVGGNIRDLWFAMYDWYQSTSHPPAIKSAQ